MATHSLKLQMALSERSEGNTICSSVTPQDHLCIAHGDHVCVLVTCASPPCKASSSSSSSSTTWLAHGLHVRGYNKAAG
jgi:hypothetical protein